MTVTAAEITDSRLDVIGYARDVLERARLEVGDRPHIRVTFAMAALEGALRGWDKAREQQEKDETARMAGLRALQLLNIIGDVLGRDAASYVAGDSSDEEGGEAA